MKAINVSKLIKQYKGLWITLTQNNKVISADKTLKKAYYDAVAKGYKDPIVFKVPTEDIPFIG